MIAKKKIAPLVLVAALVAIWLVLGPKLPKNQVVHVVLGEAAARVTEVRIRYSEVGAGEGDFTREATFRYALGAAPRVITHEPRLPDGEYLVEIDLYGRDGQKSGTVRRRVKIDSNSPVSLDVGEAVP